VQSEFKSAAQQLKEELDDAVRQYKQALGTRETRIKEYDTAKQEGRVAHLDIADQMIKKAAAEAEERRKHVSMLEQRLKSTEAKLREHTVTMQGGIKYDADIGIGQLEDVVFSDEGNHMKSSGKSVPLVVDPSGSGMTFLTYRSALVVDIGNSHHMHPRQMALNILGCLRFGKPLVINLRDKPLPIALQILQEKADAAHPGLYQQLVRKTIREPINYERLITEDIVRENKELDKKTFTPYFTERFVVVLMSQNKFPEEEAMSGFYTVHISA
jgi:hypothetical protein